MSLSLRAKNAFFAGIRSKKYGQEVVNIVEIVPFAGTKASFSGSVMQSAATFAQFSGQVAGMTTDVTIDADFAGAAGNVTLVASPGWNITDLVTAWNIAHPTNTLTISSGNPSQEPTADITLSGGIDQVNFTLTVEANAVGTASNKTITGDGASTCAVLIGAGYNITAGGASIPATGVVVSISGGLDIVVSGGTLSTKCKFFLKNAFCDKKAYEAFVYAVENDSSIDARTKKIFSTVICDKKSYNEWIVLL